MALLWYPGQDPDFMSRLDRLEKILLKDRKASCQHDNADMSELEAENRELRIRLDSMEEDIIYLMGMITQIEDQLGCKFTKESGTLPEYGGNDVQLRDPRVPRGTA